MNLYCKKQQDASLCNRDIANKITTGILAVLDSKRMGYNAASSPTLINAIVGALEARNFFSLKDGPVVHAAFMEILANNTLPCMFKQAAFCHWLRHDAGRSAKIIPDFLSTDHPNLPWFPLIPASILLWSNRLADARIWLKAIQNINEVQTTEHLTYLCNLFYARGKLRAALACWRALMALGPLQNAEQIAFAQFMLDIGRPLRLDFAKRAEPISATPEDRLRIKFIAQMSDRLESNVIRHEARQALECESAVSSIMKLFAPSSRNLTFRLEAVECPPARDMRLACGYAAWVMASLDIGRSHLDDWLASSRFVLFSPFIDEFLTLLDRKYADDARFCDGYAVLSFYSWCAGDMQQAATYLEQEHFERDRDAVGYLRLAIATGLLGQLKRSAGFLEQIFKQYPEFIKTNTTFSVRSMLALLLKVLGWPDEAKKICGTLVSNPAWHYRSSLYDRAPCSANPIATGRVLHECCGMSI